MAIRNIAAVVSGMDEEYPYQIIQGINKYAQKNSINVSYFSAFGGILTRIVSKKTDILNATGISLFFGGGIMIISGLIFGGRLNTVTPEGIFILFCLTLISVYGFSIYNYLLSKYPVGEIAIFNSLIPIMGVILSCIILNEPFKAQYIIAGILVSLGVYIINSQEFVIQKRRSKAYEKE